MEIKELNELIENLGQRLNVDNGSILASQLAEVEAWSAYVARLAVEAKKVLRERRNQYLLPKSSGTTELDRSIRMDAAVAEYEARATYLNDLQDIIQRRIILGQSILKSLRTELESGL
jgi:hypothetical protein